MYVNRTPVACTVGTDPFGLDRRTGAMVCIVRYYYTHVYIVHRQEVVNSCAILSESDIYLVLYNMC